MGKGTRRFGLITTNSLRQTFNRKVLEPHLTDSRKPLSLIFVIADHPWVDTQFGAAVRISMTVGAAGKRSGRLLVVESENREKSEADGRAVTFNHQIGKIFANLQIGADVVGAKPLVSNARLVTPGVIPHGDGMVISKAEATRLNPPDGIPYKLLRPYCNGKELISGTLNRYVIDAFPRTEEELIKEAPTVYQWLLDKVKPHRDANRDRDLREKWWLHRRNNLDLRRSQEGIERFVGTVLTSKHRFFVFLPVEVLPDQTIVAISHSDAAIFAVLSSKQHLLWSLSTGGTLEDRPRYLKTTCFDPFPFPDLTDPQRIYLRQLGEDLDAHRKRQQAAHPKLTLTQMYNVLEKLRAGDMIEGKDKDIYDQGLIGILRDLHDQIDAAVADAYGWPVDLSDEDILLRLVALNKKRAEEEARGHIRWLRPEYQNPTGAQAALGKTTDMDLGVVAKIEKAPWPKTMPEQIAAVREALTEMGEATPEQIARRFVRGRAVTVEPLMESLAALGQAERGEDGRFAA